MSFIKDIIQPIFSVCLFIYFVVLPGKYKIIPLYAILIAGLVIILYIIFDGVIKRITKKTIDGTKREIVELVVEDLFESIPARPSRTHYRTNIMVPTKRKYFCFGKRNLEIIYRKNMNQLDRAIKFTEGTGVIWKAFESKTDTVVDFTEVKSSVFGLSSVEEKRIWKDLKSLYSVPILDNKDEVLGILSIDSDLKLENSCLERKKFVNKVISTCALLAVILKEE